MQAKRSESTPTQKGLTLIEVLIATLLLGSIALAMGTLLPMASVTQKTVSEDTFAITLARNKLENIRSLGYSQIGAYDSLYQKGVVDAAPSYSPYSFTDVDRIPDKLLNGSGTLWIEKRPDDQDLFRVKVRIDWTDSKGRNRSIFAATEVGNV
jgi:prepilin-type N-terminal cleavage/methylation domain-containing protein